MLTLLDKINDFIARQEGMTERRFGELALNDKNFVADMKEGRSPSLNTAARVEDFMRAYPNHEPFISQRKAA